MKFFRHHIFISLSILILALIPVQSCMHGGTLSSVKITPVRPVLAPGTTQQLTATATLTDGTTLNWTTNVRWESADETIASVSNAVGTSGVAIATSISGTVTVTATDVTNTNITQSIQLIVKNGPLDSITVSPTDAILSAETTTMQFAATGDYAGDTPEDITPQVTWKSTNTGVATVSNTEGSRGVVTRVAPGTTSIVATDSATNISGSAELQVE